MDIIKYLPDDIIRYIIPFTYKLQNKELLSEIRLYVFFCNRINDERQQENNIFVGFTNMELYKMILKEYNLSDLLICGYNNFQ
jgi:hypothetical protein